jgi:hypothetical protein
MMKRVSIIIGFCIFLIFILSCKRDKPAGFVIGEQDMKIESYDSLVIEGSNSYEKITLDINNDWKDDFVIFSSNSTPHEAGPSYDRGIYPLHDKAYFNGTNYIDSIFTHTTVAEYYSDYYGKMVRDVRIYTTCERQTSEDTFVELRSTFGLSCYRQGDEIIYNSKWYSDHFGFRILTSGLTSQTNYDPTYPVDNTETLMSFVTYVNRPNSHFPTGEIVYIAVKVKNRYGWIKLKVEGENKVTLIETAIER